MAIAAGAVQERISKVEHPPVPSFLFELIGCLKKEQHTLLGPYTVKYLRTKTHREAWLLGFDVIEGSDAARFFKAQGYKLMDHHLSVDKWYSNQRDWLSLAHATFVYRLQECGEDSFGINSELKIHIYFNKEAAQWSVRAKKKTSGLDRQQEETVIFREDQIKRLKTFSESASVLLQDLLSEHAKRYRNALEKNKAIERLLSTYSMDLGTKDKRNRYRLEAHAFQASLDKLKVYDSSFPVAQKQSFVQKMLDVFDRRDAFEDAQRVVVLKSEKPSKDPAIDTVLPKDFIAEKKPEKDLNEKGKALYKKMQALATQVSELLLEKSTQLFFNDFSCVDDLHFALLEVVFFDASWKRPHDFCDGCKKSEKLLEKAKKERDEKIKSFFERAHVEPIDYILSAFFESDHFLMLESIVAYCKVFIKQKDKTFSKNQLNILDWYFSKKYNLYQSVVRQLSNLVMIVDNMSFSFLFAVYSQNHFELFNKFLNHGFNPNLSGFHIKDGFFYSLLTSMFYVKVPHGRQKEYIELLMQYGAVVDYKIPKIEGNFLTKNHLEWMAPSDLWLACHLNRKYIPCSFIEKVPLWGLALGLYELALNQSVCIFVGQLKVSGVYSSHSLEQCNALVQSQEQGLRVTLTSYRLKLVLVFNPDDDGFGNQILECLNTQWNLRDIQSAIEQLKNLVQLNNASKAFTLAGCGAIQLLIAGYSLFESLNLPIIKIFVEVSFRISEMVSSETKKDQKIQYLRLIETLPEKIDTWKETIESWPIYQIAVARLRQLERAAPVEPVLFSSPPIDQASPVPENSGVLAQAKKKK